MSRGGRKTAFVPEGHSLAAKGVGPHPSPPFGCGDPNSSMGVAGTCLRLCIHYPRGAVSCRPDLLRREAQPPRGRWMGSTPFHCSSHRPPWGLTAGGRAGWHSQGWRGTGHGTKKKPPEFCPCRQAPGLAGARAELGVRPEDAIFSFLFGPVGVTFEGFIFQTQKST